MVIAPRTPLFIVGTGRCGSTMLSKLLALHPELLSLSELFNSLLPLAFSHDPLDGIRLWYILSEPRVRHTVWLRLMERGLVIDEFRYPLARAKRFLGTGIPPLLAMTLPPLTDDPDGLHEELREFVQALPTDRLATHHARIFAWLCERLGRRSWCERSGSSLNIVHILIRAFPDARFVHVYRDGRECAISAQKFHPMRLSRIGEMIRRATGMNPYTSAMDYLPKGLPEPWQGLMPHGFDLDSYARVSISLSPFAEVWSEMTTKGMEHLAKLPPERVLHLRYESLLAAPQAELQRVIRFLDPELEDPSWVERAAAEVRPNPSKWQALPAMERAALETACAKGMAVLAGLEPSPRWSRCAWPTSSSSSSCAPREEIRRARLRSPSARRPSTRRVPSPTSSPRLASGGSLAWRAPPRPRGSAGRSPRGAPHDRRWARSPRCDRDGRAA